VQERLVDLLRFLTHHLLDHLGGYMVLEPNRSDFQSYTLRPDAGYKRFTITRAARGVPRVPNTTTSLRQSIKYAQTIAFDNNRQRRTGTERSSSALIRFGFFMSFSHYVFFSEILYIIIIIMTQVMTRCLEANLSMLYNSQVISFHSSLNSN